jgi:hypothetical protein
VKESATTPESADTTYKPTLDRYHAALESSIEENTVRARYLNVDDFHISLQEGKEWVRQVVAVISYENLLFAVRTFSLVSGTRFAISWSHWLGLRS